ncbi:MAG TPA: hypothetical protein VFI18_09945 [Gaiellales bacterium]|nr:hypothetical protein [Gaiellales bacterium]
MTAAFRIMRLAGVAITTVAMATAAAAPAALADPPMANPQGAAVAGPKAANDGRWVALTPDRADGLGSARLRTIPSPVVIVRSEPDPGFDWMDAGIGAAVALAAVLVIAAARLDRAERPLPE